MGQNKHYFTHLQYSTKSSSKIVTYYKRLFISTRSASEESLLKVRATVHSTGSGENNNIPLIRNKQRESTKARFMASAKKQWPLVIGYNCDTNILPRKSLQPGGEKK